MVWCQPSDNSEKEEEENKEIQSKKDERETDTMVGTDTGYAVYDRRFCDSFS